MITLRRLTNTGTYLPFIDGLRFFAILPVLLVHFVDFYEAHTQKLSDGLYFKRSQLDLLTGNSDNAVLLFFAISGFVLGLPFARRFLNKEEAPDLGPFYLRRLTRLEPPYLLVLTVLMLMNVFLFHKSSLAEQLPHYFASFFYLHNIIYKAFPEINFVFWSLEIEVQFYLLAPFLARLFKLAAVNRRILLFAAMLFSGIVNQYHQPPFISLFNYIQYFLAGFLALDLYLTTSRKSYVFDVTALLLLVICWTGILKYGPILPFALAGFIYCASQSLMLNRWISSKWISITGGMCYSLYMLHYPVMAVFLNRIIGNDLLVSAPALDLILKLILSMVFVFVVSAAFFVGIERPCMNKNWPSALFKRKLSASR